MEYSSSVLMTIESHNMIDESENYVKLEASTSQTLNSIIKYMVVFIWNSQTGKIKV